MMYDKYDISNVYNENTKGMIEISIENVMNMKKNQSGKSIRKTFFFC
jgi:hypothetical protein